MFYRQLILAAGAVGLVACATGPVPGADPEAEEQRAFAAERFRAEVSGRGEPVVFIHGLASSPRAFEGVTAGLPGSVHLVTVAGFGGTEPPSSLDPFVEPIAEELRAYLRDVDARNAVLVGHSMGGVIAMLTAAGTERVGGVIVIDSVPFLAGLFQPGATPAAAASLRPAMQQQFEAMTELEWSMFTRQGLARQSLTPEGQSRVAADMEGADMRASQAAFIDLMTKDFTVAFRDVDVPVLVLVPFDASSGFPKEAVRARYEEQYADMPWVRIEMIEGSRHFITFDQPAAFRSALEDFLRTRPE